ncbi:MAG: chemotaxis protein CheB [Deltaproteobacteria bacterium]|nr:chemotaxis protein CheB [Deltaproteobacteria bacterium]
MRPKRVIVIGASAGGLTALRQLFSELDPALPAAIFAVLHTASDSRYLASILGHDSQMPVRKAENGPIDEGVIYIAPPDLHMILERDGMRLVQGPKENLHRPSIDVLFRSAGFTYRSAVIGIVLTGMLDDGTAGLFYVKRYGGIAIVQDPNEAEFKSMPLNASTYVNVDYSVRLAEIPPLLNKLVRPELPPSINPPFLESLAVAMREEDLKSGTLSIYTCPECGGPLTEIRNASLTRFRCRTGHAYGLSSLSYSQAETTERLLWSALQSLEAKVELEKTMLELASIRKDTSALEECKKRYHDSQRGMQLLKEVLKLSNGEGTID